MSRNWTRPTHDAVMLGLEAQRVIGLRKIKLSGGAWDPGRGIAHGFGKNRRAGGSRVDAGPRGLSWEGHTTLSNACQIEQTALIEVIRAKPTQDEFRGFSLSAKLMVLPSRYRKSIYPLSIAA